MGTSWISRKGGILKNGDGLDLEKGGGGSQPPLPTMIKVFLTKKALKLHVNALCSLLNMKKKFSLMNLFLSLSCISLEGWFKPSAHYAVLNII